MRDFARKVGSIGLGVGALSALLVNAALTHGCGGWRLDAPATQAGAPPPTTAEQPHDAGPPQPAAPDATASDDDTDCDEAPYMHATKAPVMPMRRCGKSKPNARQTSEPLSPANNAQRQAP